MNRLSGRLIENIFSMVTLRALEYILAFILVPYLLRVLGPSNFGAVVFMQGLMGYLVLVVNYGFNLTAPRALARADEEDISFVFSVYMWARILLWISVTGVFFFIYEGLRVFFQVEMDMPLFWAVLYDGHWSSYFSCLVFPGDTTDAVYYDIESDWTIGNHDWDICLGERSRGLCFIGLFAILYSGIRRDMFLISDS